MRKKTLDGCVPARSARPGRHQGSLAALVADYLRCYGSRHRAEFAWYARMPLADAVRVAALSTVEDGRRHPHQRRLPATVLAAGARDLGKRDLSGLRSFDELHEIVAKVQRRGRGLGAVWAYDVATRVAAQLRLEPQRVYLHAGTRAGAKALGLSTRAGVLEMSDLP